MSGLERITGQIVSIIYYNEHNGYTVADMDWEEQLVTVVGFFPELQEGEQVSLSGKWVTHPEYGMQFKAESFHVEIPSSEESIEKYLASGVIKGIGPVTAKRMVRHFGKDTLDIIQFHPYRLTEVEGIGEKKAEQIILSYEEQQGLREVMLFLQNYGVTPRYAVKLYKKYGEKTIATLKENPYKMAEDVIGIGFKIADQVAMNMGIDPRSNYRITAGVKYALYQVHNNGHIYYPEEQLIANAAKLLEVPREEVQNYLVDMVMKGHIKLEMIDEERVYYSIAFYRAEEEVAWRIVALSMTESEENIIDLQDKINGVEKKNNILLAARQRQAIEESMDKGVLVITGGPGTGKTTIINSILDILEEMDEEVLLAAPTGRAAKRMAEATGREAKTIHRLLEYGFAKEEENQYFQKNEEAPLEADVVIIDEVSMVDILLMNHLLKAIQPGTRLILVGDVDQLPSVGPGNVLKDIIESGVVKVVQLNEIFRQAQESMIVVNAHHINKGELPLLNVKNKDFFFHRIHTKEEVLSTLVDLCSTRLPKYKGFDPLQDIQVLSPMKKGILGVHQLNQSLQEKLNSPHKNKKQKQMGEVIFREGDKVMQIKNNYNIRWENIADGEELKGEGVFNGDFGIIESIDLEEGKLRVIFDEEKLVEYEFNQLDELELAYAVTVHKSQGSEFSVVVMPMSWGPPMLLTRNLLYTAVTRAKSLVVLVGLEKYLLDMIKNNHINKRYTGLSQRIRDKLNFLLNEQEL
ncbi:ATP-dependent RecD-like DNA helicase [Irregularibacter muris]|uniref:ATP-dependent RecD2 DNA helicase n=1 Tax=Irregularibacter muris TaxID=1796619 RepID=A0AAE3HD89_9FIRM|nr:ATP-dependent RecD-like DNA helicase [Irregularibacter muris]MCR1898236.1 ATP-dependent RecD-like DNA helicase [Irregularibacter muris]